MADAEYLSVMQKAILEKMMKDSKQRAIALTLVGEDDFNGVNKTAFCAIRDLHMDGQKIDDVLLTAKLGEGYELYVAELSNTSRPCDIETYCCGLRSGNRLRALKEKGTALAYADTLDEAERIVSEINDEMTERITTCHVDSVDAMNNFFARINEEKPRSFITWGLDALDEALYTDPGDFVVLGGYPSAGKTALACQLAMHQAERYRVGFFSLETGEDKLVDRMMSNLSGVELCKIKTQKGLTRADWLNLSKAGELYARLQMHIYSASGMTAQEIFSEALARRLQIVYVDYLQLIRTTGRGGNRYEEVTKISADLHTLAQKHRITVVALAQLSRPEKKNGLSVAPTMQSFKESGQIEQDADVGLLIYNKDEKDYRSPRVLKIAKNKEGTRASFEFDFDGSRQRFHEVFPERPYKPRPNNKKPGYHNDEEQMTI